jgi:hypothetical protein
MKYSKVASGWSWSLTGRGRAWRLPVPRSRGIKVWISQNYSLGPWLLVSQKPLVRDQDETHYWTSCVETQFQGGSLDQSCPGEICESHGCPQAAQQEAWQDGETQRA